MADTYIQLPDDGTGKKVRSFSQSIGGETVHHQASVPTDENGTTMASAATGTVTNVNDSAASGQLLAANTARKGVLMHNNSSSTLYIKYGTTASIAAGGYTFPIYPGERWEMPIKPVYQGRIDGIWDANSTGYVNITELT